MKHWKVVDDEACGLNHFFQSRDTDLGVRVFVRQTIVHENYLDESISPGGNKNR